MTVIVFTTVLGDTDPLRPCKRTPGVRHIVFSDRELNVPPYDWIYYRDGVLGPQLASRRLKILADHEALQAADVTLWHDAAYQLTCDPQRLADQYLRDHDVLAMRHPHRSSIEQEAAVIARLGYMRADVLAAQVAEYRAAGWTTQTAITSTGFCLRRRTPAVEAWQTVWWGEVARWGYRDQMSVDYALWRSDVRVHYIPGHYRDNPNARWFNNHLPQHLAPGQIPRQPAFLSSRPPRRSRLA